MRQLFAPGADAIFRLSLLVVVVGVVGLFLVTAGFSRSSFVTNVGVAPDQPAPFSHKHHSGNSGSIAAIATKALKSLQQRVFLPPGPA